jgi:hypothetical protein
MIRNRCLLLSMVLLVVCLFTPYKSLAQSTIACNSDDGRRHSCAVDTRGGVQLVRQNSQAPCTEGRSWGSDNEGIWVDDGCRADFSVGANRDFRDEKRNDHVVLNPNVQDEHHFDQYGGDREQQRFNCNSDNMRKHSCYIDTRGGEVRLVRQLSDAACTRGYSWGTNRRGIWVDHGCRANFAVVIARYHGDSWR